MKGAGRLLNGIRIRLKAFKKAGLLFRSKSGTLGTKYGPERIDSLNLGYDESDTFRIRRRCPGLA